MVTSKPQQTSLNFGFPQAIRSSIFSYCSTGYSLVSDVSITVLLIPVYNECVFPAAHKSQIT